MINATAIAPTLVSYSTVGFILVLGSAAFVPIVYEQTFTDDKVKMAKMVRRYPYRVISRLSGDKSIKFLLGICLCFIVVGILSLSYFWASKEILIFVALILSIVISILLFILVTYLSLHAFAYDDKELDLIIRYSDDGYEK